MSIRILLSYRHPPCMPGGDVLPPRRPLGSYALSPRGIQRYGRARGMHTLPAGVYLSRLWSNRSNAMSCGDGVQPDHAYVSESAVSTRYGVEHMGMKWHSFLYLVRLCHLHCIVTSWA